MEGLQVFLGFILVCSGMSLENTTTQSREHKHTYVISVPKALRCGVPATLSVTILTEHPITVTTELLHGRKSVAQIQSTIPGGSTKMLDLPPVFYDDHSFPRPYELHVKGFVGKTQVFSNSTTMIFSPKCVSIFIQTDKNSYQPGQAVKFRVVSLTPNGKPYKGKIDIFIQDPRGNMIRQWLSVNAVLGAVSEELILSQNPSEGQWSIIAEIDEVVQRRQFRVEYYVLPKFEVNLDVPSIHYHEDTLVGTVNARYFYGKPVSGVMNVSFDHFFYGYHVQNQQVGRIDGSASFTFEVPELGNTFVERVYYDIYRGGEYIDISVNVTEHATGLTYNNSARVSIVKSKYNLAFLQHPQFIKPAMNFSSLLKVSTYNGHPLTDEERREGIRLVTTQYKSRLWMMKDFEEAELHLLKPQNRASTFSSDKDITVQEMTYNVSADGIVSFHTTTADDVAMLHIEARFRDTVRQLELYSSGSGSYMHLHNNSDPQVGQPLALNVESNLNLTRFHYVVMSRGWVVNAGTSDSLYFSLYPDQSWTPLACVLVYYTLSDGEIVNDALQVTFTQVLTNKVSLRWSQDRAKPGDSVSVSVSVSESGSLVGFLVVDKATLDSKTDNGITVKTVLEEFMSYSGEMINTEDTRYLYSAFTKCGVTVLTDARLNQENNIMFFEFRDIAYTDQASDGPINKTRERKYFPETWIWLDADMGNSTSKSFPFTVPDSMTSWVAFGIVLSEGLGLGISDPAELTVFQSFFLSLNLPAFIIRGELLLLEVNLFNYMDVDLEVIVVIAESPMFEFVSQEEFSLANVRKVYVMEQNITSILFPVRATVLGEIVFSVKATSIFTSDLVRKTVLVKPEGMEQSSTQTLFLEFPFNQRILSRSLEFIFPADVVYGSQRASVSAVGDILGPSIGNLDSLIQLPYGCGEQNMIHFAPNVYVLQYLRSSGQNEEQTRNRAMSYMQEAYERELSYQRTDGSFSAFGDHDRSGSTWLSAFVLRCFLQARTFIPIDPNVMQRTALWLQSQQNPDGSFREPGYVIHSELQGGLDGPVSLTAYVLMALLEDDEYRIMLEASVSTARSYLTTQLSLGITSNYSLCLVTYALSLANSSVASSALTQLLNRAIMRDGVPSWSTPGNVLSSSWQPRSSDIEMSAYVLLSMHRLARMDEGFNLMKWLSLQRNHLGGYGSTQDTVMALHALSVYARYGSSAFLNLSIAVSNLMGPVANFNINKTNYLLLQSQDLMMDAEDRVKVEVVARGQGFALFQLNVFYNINGLRTSRRRRDVYTDDFFYLYVDVADDDTFHINIHICFSLRPGQGLNQTGMAILDVGLLTGFTLNQDTMQTDDVVRRIETPPGRVILYLSEVNTVERCVDIPTILDFKVTNVQDAVVMIYDYYEPLRKTVRSYTSVKRRDMTVCSLCGFECAQCQNQDHSPTDGTSSFNKHHLLTIIFTTLLILLSVCN
ncbi:CD109 antigen isoform X2 [Triplophysa dalaica]|uniref:CD109 antigen isoform X2 n=1 Tax=Triplophysa dalaica TaxID=1582913 RepID=UPI0024DFCD51|nr:CD109 antigen isoform X2 [Triplophysa dalaica]